MTEQGSRNIVYVVTDRKNTLKQDFGVFEQKMRRDHVDSARDRYLIISFGPNGYRLRRDNIEIIQCRAIFGRMRVPYDLAFLLLVPAALLAARFKPDYVFLHDAPYLFSAALVRLFWRAKTVFFLGNLPSELAGFRRFSRLSTAYQALFETIFFRSIDKAFAISEVTRNYLVERGVAASRVVILPPNVLQRDLTYVESAKAGRVRWKHGLDEDSRIILAVGRLQREKGHDRLLKEFAALDDDKAVLVLVGDGPMADELRRQVTVLGLEPRVVFAGSVSRQEIWDYYLDADAFVLLSLSEGLGLVFWEAMYMGVPVIGSRVGGIAETIGSGEERGYFWNNDDPARTLPAILDRIFSEAEEVSAKRQLAKDYVTSKINNNQSVNDLL